MILSGGYTAPDLIAIISASSAALVAIITAIGTLLLTMRTGQKVDVVDAKLTTRNGNSIGTQMDQLTTAQATATPPELRTATQIAHLAEAPSEEKPPA